MKVKQSLLVAGAIATVGGATFLGANAVSAQTSSSTLVEKVSTQFNLDQTEVQSVFDDHRDERQADKQAMMAEMLQAKVDDGTITAEQKTLIEEKMVEVQVQFESLRDSDLTKDEIREQMKQTKEDLAAWAEENGITVEDILGGRGKGMGAHRGGQGGPRDF